ncbi:MAG: hypothetical protein GDA55_03165 [Cellvibrionales bacterium]|nr:hypothetical protein [Cellvibrionales bacterium]
MKGVKAACFGLFALLGACALEPPPPAMTPLQIQTLQTRQYENDKDVVFASVVSVFQDLGYSIKGADKDTGFISAESATTGGAADFLDLLFDQAQSSQTFATAFVERIGDKTSVRLNFVTRHESSSEYGQNRRHDSPILDAETYQNAFERIENAIFVRSAN